ncbi:hypothetical protein BLJ79_01220 [Arthrobacter sp. UCD-GKA]|uniref:GrpB family protein n=1 Tax=Arthrobacter sp. UCD-GKA TaxID=1913576 RepID=UPI0008DD8977|nr:GrpB family protein [Arthrobacter sp. UCD-GKA]OIH86618.1 hypothetical protein BLJ79_01220 [Arthrobacter sp. UCD-GKA]
MHPEWFDRPGGEPVELCAGDPLWPEAAAEWAVRIRSAILPTLATVEHVGSTAVPGLVAKPVLDLQVAVPDITHEAAYRPGLESLGLVLRQRASEHRFFRPPAGEPRTVHVHVCGSGSAWERDHLRFRDRLRADPALAARYAALKRSLAGQVGHDRFAYNDGKSQFIADAIAQR